MEINSSLQQDLLAPQYSKAHLRNVLGLTHSGVASISALGHSFQSLPSHGSGQRDPLCRPPPAPTPQAKCPRTRTRRTETLPRAGLLCLLFTPSVAEGHVFSGRILFPPSKSQLGQVPFAVPQTWTSGDAVATLVTCVLPILAAKLVQTALIELPTPLGTFPRQNLSPAPSLHP